MYKKKIIIFMENEQEWDKSEKSRKSRCKPYILFIFFGTFEISYENK